MCLECGIGIGRFREGHNCVADSRQGEAVLDTAPKRWSRRGLRRAAYLLRFPSGRSTQTTVNATHEATAALRKGSHAGPCMS